MHLVFLTKKMREEMKMFKMKQKRQDNKKKGKIKTALPQ